MLRESCMTPPQVGRRDFPISSARGHECARQHRMGKVTVHSAALYNHFQLAKQYVYTSLICTHRYIRAFVHSSSRTLKCLQILVRVDTIQA